MPRNHVLMVLAAAAAVALGCTRQAEPPTPVPKLAPIPPVTRYECLILRKDGSVVTSKGFPKYYPADASPNDPAIDPTARQDAQLLGTVVSIVVYGGDPDEGRAAIAAALDRVAQLSKKLNLFDPKSEVSRVNRDAWKGPVEIEPDLAGIIRRSREMAALTCGAFDATCGPVTALWRRCRANEKLPSDEEVEKARALVGFDKVTLSESGGATTVKFAGEGMSFDFGGIAKGLASEEAAKVLVARGIRSAVIACSGNVRLVGTRPDGKPFRVGIIDPKTVDANETWRFVVPLAGACIDTSGNYRQFTVIDAVRYSHIVDPRTGRSIEAEPSVTTIGPDAETCDALSTTISILGVEEGLKLLDRINGGK